MTLKHYILEESSHKTLYDYLGYYPDDDEVLWEFVSPYQFKNDKIDSPKEMNIEELYNNLNVVGGYEKYKDSVKGIEKESKIKIKDIRKNIREYIDDPIIIMEDELIDGYHRLVAFYLENIDKIKVLDISTMETF